MRRHGWLSALILCSLPVGVAAGAPTKNLVELGRRLFLDPAVSRTGRFSCAACHQPEHGFSDPRVKSEDETGASLRHSQPLTDLVDGKGMHWDGEFDTLRQLLTARLGTPAEAVAQSAALLQQHMAASLGRGEQPDQERFRKRLAEIVPPYYGPRTPTNGSPAPTVTVSERLREQDYYAMGFRLAFGDEKITDERVIGAMEAYLLSLQSGPSPYDRYLGGDPGALSASARRGLTLFQGKANCAACHAGAATLSDGRFHNTGVAFHSLDLALESTLTGDGGLGTQSFVASDLGKFKTPSLRNVALRPPYMHDGSFASLSEVVRYYSHGGTPNRHLDADVRPLDLTETEISDLVAFLESLTSEERPGLGDLPAHRAELTRVRVLDLQGRPLRGLDVEIVPFGDRLGRRSDAERPLLAKTDRVGEVCFSFPSTTHVQLRAEGMELGLERPIPDYVRSATVTAVPRSGLYVRVRREVRNGSMPAAITANLPGGGSVRLERARNVGTREAWYRAPVKDPSVGWLGVQLAIGAEAVVPCSLDFGGGESDPVVLRAGG